MKKRWFHTVLALCLALSILPVPALAAPAEELTAEAVEEHVLPSRAAGQTDEDFFYEYLLAQAGGRPGARLAAVSTSAGSKLTGNNKIIYDILKQRVAQVAAGTLTSTIFNVTLTDLGITQETWTEADLGVPIYVDGSISAAAAVLREKVLAYDSRAILDALLMDCPYELYWYDKTAGYSAGGAGVGGKTVNGEWVLYFSSENVLHFDFSVASEYAASSTEASATKIQQMKVSTAVSNAKKIVSDNAGKSDYEKLDAYREAICSLASYNHDAADNDSTPYGNPWQLIWVFDGDESTNIVCEGYSKAFQYLCDLSTFQSGVECFLATGTMGGGTGAGPHMWNIVTMGDGKNYLVDITNCDEGSTGWPNYLFLRGVSAGSGSVDYVANIPQRDAPGGGYYSASAINYTYDDFTKRIWPASLLALSAADYDDSAVPVTCTVTFSAGGGTGSMTAATVDSGASYTLPANGFTAPAGKQFKAWSVDGKEYAAGAKITVSANTTVTAVWEDIPVVTYTVTFSAGGGTGSMTAATVDSGASYTLPANGFTAPTGKQFKAWSVDGREYAAGAKITVSANTTVTAVWEDIPVVTYTVTFNAGGGSGTMTAATVEDGQSYTLPANGFTAPTGKQFKAWSVNGKEYAAGAKITVSANTTVTAVWEDIPSQTPSLAAPKLVSAEAVSNGITVKWNAVSGATGYRVYRKTAGGKWATVKYVSGTAFKDTSVTAGTTYFYTVRCMSGSDVASGYDAAGVSAAAWLAAPKLTSIAAVSNGITVKWNAVSGATGYRVYRKTAGGKWATVKYVSGTAFKDTTVTPGTTYSYTVRCMSGSSVASDYDTTGLSAAAWLAAPKLTSIAAVSNGITVRWNAVSGATGYRVYRKTAGGAWTTVKYVSGTAFKDTTVTPGTTYSYTVRCMSGSGVASDYDTAGLSAVAWYAAPSLASAESAANGITVKWTAVSGVSQYRVYRKTAGGAWATLKNVSGTTFTDTTAQAGTTYFYTVRCLSGSALASGYDSTGVSAAR